jgi:hypothetical protein
MKKNTYPCARHEGVWGSEGVVVILKPSVSFCDCFTPGDNAPPPTPRRQLFPFEPCRMSSWSRQGCPLHQVQMSSSTRHRIILCFMFVFPKFLSYNGRFLNSGVRNSIWARLMEFTIIIWTTKFKTTHVYFINLHQLLKRIIKLLQWLQN